MTANLFITSAEMAAIDTNCEYHGLSRLQLMENAGKALAEVVRERAERLGLRSILIFAGLGNNGGDAFVAARHLKGFKIEILLLGRERDIRSDAARRNFEILKKSGFKIWEIEESSEIKLEEVEIILDAMLGTGVRGALKEPFRSVVEIINSAKAYKISVDVPTGLNPDTGEYEVCVKADVTVTFHKNKLGLAKAKDRAGEVVVRDIGIPETYEMLCGPGDVKMVYRRDLEAHKGMHGRILIVGGGGYTGAPVLAAFAALNAGADIVTLAVPESIYTTVASFSPNLIVRKLRGSRISMENVVEVEELAEKHDVVVMGMGVGDIEFEETAAEILKGGRIGKAVLDAEGITKDVPEEVECILTPHRGEFKRVFGREATFESVRREAEKAGVVILLKAREDVISDGKRVRVNRSGNAGMTVGGTGDVLSGLTGAFFVNGNALWSASAAAFINGYAGDLCFKEKGYNFTAMDVANKLPEAIRFAVDY